jgi:hypothetical protein
MKNTVRRMRKLAGTAALAALLPFIGLDAQAQNLGSNMYVGLQPEDFGVLQRPRPDYDAKGIPLDAWRLFPTLDAGAAYDSNVFRIQNNPLGDMYFVISPALKLVTNWGANALEVFAGADNYIYSKYDTETLSDWNAGGDGRFGIFPGAEIFTAATVNMLHERRASPNTTGFQAGPNRYYLYDFQSSGTYQRGLFGVGAGFQYDKYDFNPIGRVGGGVISNSDRDMDEFKLWGKVNYDFSPGYQIFVKTSYNERNYSDLFDRNNLRRSSHGTRADLGVQAQLTHLIMGSVQVGYLHQNFFAPLKDADGLAYTVNVDYFATPLLTIHLTADRQLQASIINNVSVTDNRSYQISADYELLRDLILQAHYAYNKDVFTSTTRIDNVDDFGISGRYLVNRYLSFNVDYAYNERSSSTPNASFTDHTVLIGVRLHV